MRIFSFNFWFFQLPLWCFLIFLIWFIPWVFLLYSGILIYFPYKEDGKSRFLRISGPVAGAFTNNWASQKDIPNSCRAALVASEDARFYEHIGVDFEFLQKSLVENKRTHKTMRGGSTITQQLVKNAFLSRKKSYIRKIREVIGALALNVIMSKDKQIEWYFNIVEFGPNTYGIENAAQRYFKMNAKKLSPAQCVALIAILPSPKKWNQSLEKKRLTDFFVQRYKKIFINMENMALISRKELLLVQNMNLGYSQSNSILQKSPTNQKLPEKPRETQSIISNESSDDVENDEDNNDE
jgi:monofunctional glycosyltransferase